jgi:hypothetical protein
MLTTLESQRSAVTTTNLVSLCTVRYLGIFLDDPMTVPCAVLHTLSKQLRLDPVNGTSAYSTGEQRWLHATEIRESYGYVEITEQRAAFRLTRWLMHCAGLVPTGQACYSSEQSPGW